MESGMSGSAGEVATAGPLRGRMADRDSWLPGPRCSIARALEVVGTRSSMLLMREALYGTTRFDDFARRVGITEAVAAARLKELVAAGLLERTPYQDPGRRTRHEYRLTRMGRDLLPVAIALMQWGDTYLAGADGGPVLLRHDGCGAEVGVEVRCAEGHPVPIREITAEFAGDPTV